jgi:hypothetical protein
MQLRRIEHRESCCRQAGIVPKRDVVQDVVVGYWRASRHAAAFLGGARDCGF